LYGKLVNRFCNKNNALHKTSKVHLLSQSFWIFQYSRLRCRKKEKEKKTVFIHQVCIQKFYAVNGFFFFVSLDRHNKRCPLSSIQEKNVFSCSAVLLMAFGNKEISLKGLCVTVGEIRIHLMLFSSPNLFINAKWVQNW
jgi:hypothetical protein